MCMRCWEEAGQPAGVWEASRLIMDADPFGCLHIVVGDGNLEDGHLDWCMKITGEPPTAMDWAVYKALKSLPLDQRQWAWEMSNGMTCAT